MHPLELEWLALGVAEGLYYEQRSSKHLQRAHPGVKAHGHLEEVETGPKLRQDLCSLSLVCKSLNKAVTDVRLRSSRHAFHLSASGGNIESTVQTTALRARPELGQRYRGLTIVIQSGNYSPDLASTALEDAGILITRCLHLTSLTLFLGKGLEDLQDDGAADLLTACLIPALGHLHSFSLYCDNTEGPALQSVIGIMGVLGWVKPASLRLVTLRGWVDPALSTYAGDSRYLDPWLQQADPRPESTVTTHLVLKDCQISSAAFSFFLKLFDASLSHLLLSWSKHSMHHPLALSAADFFGAVARKRRVVHLTIRDLREKTPFLNCATDIGQLFSKLRLDSPVYCCNDALRTLALELLPADFHPNILTRFALPSLEHLQLTASSASAPLASLSMLSNRIANELLSNLDSAAFASLQTMTLQSFDWAAQQAGLLHEGARKRKITLRIQQ